jgi:hypothetical protein
LRQIPEGAGVGHGPQSARILGEEDVRGAVLTFFQNGGAELGRVPVPDLDVHAACSSNCSITFPTRVSSRPE